MRFHKLDGTSFSRDGMDSMYTPIVEIDGRYYTKGFNAPDYFERKPVVLKGEDVNLVNIDGTNEYHPQSIFANPLPKTIFFGGRIYEREGETLKYKEPIPNGLKELTQTIYLRNAGTLLLKETKIPGGTLPGTVSIQERTYKRVPDTITYEEQVLGVATPNPCTEVTKTEIRLNEIGKPCYDITVTDTLGELIRYGGKTYRFVMVGSDGVDIYQETEVRDIKDPAKVEKCKINIAELRKRTKENYEKSCKEVEELCTKPVQAWREYLEFKILEARDKGAFFVFNWTVPHSLIPQLKTYFEGFIVEPRYDSKVGLGIYVSWKDTDSA